MAKWTHVIELKFEIELMDGTRIGGAGGGLDIGGIDPNLMALKDPVTGEPYIPGSSLKGKLRSILEKEHGRGQRGEPCGCGEWSCPVCPIFGAHKKPDPKCGTSRLIVRDAHFIQECRNAWKENPMLEVKTENTIDRDRGTAKDPRTQERVPAGAVFEAQMLLKVFEGNDPAGSSDKMVKDLKHALAVLERYDAPGAGGSRGSGRIKIRNFTDTKIALGDVTL
jgi:CRISPR-associated protein Csm3